MPELPQIASKARAVRSLLNAAQCGGPAEAQALLDLVNSYGLLDSNGAVRGTFTKETGLRLYVFQPFTLSRIPSALRHNAHYIEVVHTDGTAEVHKDRTGVTGSIPHTTYIPPPAPPPARARRTVWDRVLDSDD